MPVPSRFPSGVSTRRVNSPLGNFPRPAPSDTHAYWDDFDTYTAAQWVVTAVGAGTAALAAADGGTIAVTTTAASSDSVFLQLTPSGFTFEMGKQAWFESRFKVNVLTSVVQLGLIVADTTPLDATDGIYFLSTTATGAVTTIVRLNATTGSTSGTGIALVADTFTTLAWYWDGKGTLTYYQDGVAKGSITGITASNFLPDTICTPSFGVQTSTTAARVLTVDYILAAKSRV